MAETPGAGEARPLHFRDIIRQLREGAIDGREALFQVALRLRSARGLSDQDALQEASTTLRGLLVSPAETSYSAAEAQDAAVRLGYYQDLVQMHQRGRNRPGVGAAQIAYYDELIGYAQQGIAREQQRLQRQEAGPQIPGVAGMTLPSTAATGPAVPAGGGTITQPPPPAGGGTTLGPPVPDVIPPVGSTRGQWLTDLFGQEGGPAKIYNQFVRQQYGQATNPFQDFVRRQSGDLLNEYMLRTGVGTAKASNFSDFLPQGIQERMTPEEFRSVLGQAGATTTGDIWASDPRRQELRSEIMGDPELQYRLALQAGQSDVPDIFRGAYKRLARDAFEAFRFQNPGGQFLPGFLGRNFRFY